jgi:hypothetical protein
MENLESFHEELAHIVARRASNDHLVDTIAFICEVSDRLEDDPIYGEFKLAEDEGRLGNKNYKIHGYTDFDESDGTLGLVIGRWFDSEKIQTLTTADVNQSFTSLENFITSSIKNSLFEAKVESSGVYEISTILSEYKNRISRIRLHLFSNGILSQRFKESLSGDIAGIQIEHQVWDLLRIKSLYESAREREQIEIVLSAFDANGISCIEASKTDKLSSYLCVVEAPLLADLFERYGSRLLEGNVRSFLGMKGGVNKGIRATIQDSPSLFFAYNNGIAATATSVQIEKTPRGLEITQLADFQIVNGGQTTASILSARKKDGLSLAGVTVQMKLTVVDVNEANLMIPKIAQYANTQNKVAVADFFANHPIHRKLEEISRRLRAPVKAGTRLDSKWFYERSRGQYQNERLYLNKSKRDLFDLEFPSTQVINKTDLAKYDSAWKGKPFWISQGAQKNFLRFAAQFSPKADISEMEHWDAISPSYGDAYYQDMAAIAMLWKKIEILISAARGDWYAGDYRAQITAYTIAEFFNVFRVKSGEFDLTKIWGAQSVPEMLSPYLISLAIKVQQLILAPPQGTTNVGEWSKKEECWNKVESLPIEWSDDLRRFLLGKTESSSRKAESKKLGQIDDGISVQSTCYELMNSGYCLALCKWPLFSEFFTPNEQSLIKKASTPKSFLTIFSDKDWRNIIKLKNKAEDEGFRYTSIEIIK